MSDASTTNPTSSTTPARRRTSNIALWALQVLLALMFAMAGLAKVGGDQAMVQMFAPPSASDSGSATWSGL